MRIMRICNVNPRLRNRLSVGFFQERLAPASIYPKRGLVGDDGFTSISDPNTRGQHLSIAWME